MTKTSILGGVPQEVSAVPLGRLKVLIPALTAFSRSVADMANIALLSEQDMEHAIRAISAGLGKTVQEVEAMPVAMDELISAIDVLADVSGLMPKGSQVGESKPGETTATTSTPSTDSSPTS